ncbi:class I SAM-dependent methyltransferase, partial [Streptomyces sp. CJ_13]|nr:class I SAM-dependent methyltransferase [Streptomyces sp. CJ_13]
APEAAPAAAPVRTPVAAAPARGTASGWRALAKDLLPPVVTRAIVAERKRRR